MKVFYLKFDLALWELVICFFRLFFSKWAQALKSLILSDAAAFDLFSFLENVKRLQAHQKGASPTAIFATVHYQKLTLQQRAKNENKHLTHFFLYCVLSQLLLEWHHLFKWELDAYLNRVTSTFIKTFNVVSFLSNMVHKN